MEWESLSERHRRHRSEHHRSNARSLSGPTATDGLLHTATLLTEQQREQLDDFSAASNCSFRDHSGFVSSMGSSAALEHSSHAELGPRFPAEVPLSNLSSPSRSGPPNSSPRPKAEELPAVTQVRSRQGSPSPPPSASGSGGVVVLTLPSLPSSAFVPRSVNFSPQFQQERRPMGVDASSSPSNSSGVAPGSPFCPPSLSRSRSLGSFGSSTKGSWQRCSPLEKQKSLQEVGSCIPRRDRSGSLREQSLPGLDPAQDG